MMEKDGKGVDISNIYLQCLFYLHVVSQLLIIKSRCARCLGEPAFYSNLMQFSVSVRFIDVDRVSLLILSRRDSLDSIIVIRSRYVFCGHRIGQTYPERGALKGLLFR